MTKSGKRQGAAESVTLTEQHVLTHLWDWKRRVPPHAFLTLKPHAWRTLFADCIQKLKLTQWEIRPHSLRRGGATHLFVKCGSLDKVVLAGRWTAVKTARIYINSGLAMLSEIKISKPLLSPFHKIFSTWKLKPSPAKRAGLGDVERSARRKIWEQKEGGSLIFFLKKVVPGIFLWCGEIFRRHGKVIFSPVWRRKIHLSPLRGWGYLLWQPNNFLPFRTVSIWLNWSATHVKTMCCECFIYI